MELPALNIRRLVLDVDKAMSRPSLLEIGLALSLCADVEAINMNITIEGEHMSYEEIVAAIEKTGAVVHSIDQLAAGNRIIDEVKRAR